MWINLKCKYIMRDGKSVKVARGEEIPEAEFWPDRDRLERTRFIRKVPDAEVKKPEAKPEPAPKTEEAIEKTVTTEEVPAVEEESKPKKRRGRPRTVKVPTE